MISVDWPTGVITVPQSYMTQISANVWTLDVDQFRLDLKDLEDDVAGMPWPRTHSHVTQTVLSGVTYARIVEIINGYTVDFEDGQYTVSVVGGNHNLADVKVPNQVSLIVNNAAGLVDPGITPQVLADAVWDEPVDDHQIPGSTGAELDSAELNARRAFQIGAT